MSGENKIDQQRAPSNKITLAKVRKNKSLPRIDERYSMMIIGPNCHSGPIDPGIIVKKKYDPNIHPELIIIDPYTKKEITRNKGPHFGFIQPEFQPKDKKDEIQITTPSE